MRFGFVGPSYTSRSTAIADEECINLYAETLGSQGAIRKKSPYGGQTAESVINYYGTPGLSLFNPNPLPGVPRGSIEANGRMFVVAGAQLVEMSSAGAQTNRGAVANDGNPASLAFNSIQILIVSGGHAYCFTLATNVLVDVTASLAGTPIQCDEQDTYFMVQLQGTNKFQFSQLLDGTTWPAPLVNAVSKFPENLVATIFNHGELWVFGSKHCQPYQDTGSANAFDPIQGVLMETGCAATFSVCRADNSVFWLGQDERGAMVAWRSNGYVPNRVSTYAVETDLSSNYTLAQIQALTSYSYQEAGHIFWVLYIPGSSFSWVYDITEGMWHKRASGWNGISYSAHWSWNHVYAFGMHLVGDWNSNNLYVMSMAKRTDNGTAIRWLRRSPTVGNEMDWLFFSQLVIDIETGTTTSPQAANCMLRWSDDRGKTWGNERILSLGAQGQYKTRIAVHFLGKSRYRVWELSGTDPVLPAIVDAYLDMAA